MPKSETHENSEFQLRGFNHLALVCKDMQETVTFYEDILGFRLVKTLQYPDCGQHFFLDMGNGIDGIAFFWFPDPPPDAPGIARCARHRPIKRRSAQPAGADPFTRRRLG